MKVQNIIKGVCLGLVLAGLPFAASAIDTEVIDLAEAYEARTNAYDARVAQNRQEMQQRAWDNDRYIQQQRDMRYRTKDGRYYRNVDLRDKLNGQSDYDRAREDARYREIENRQYQREMRERQRERSRNVRDVRLDREEDMRDRARDYRNLERERMQDRQDALRDARRL